MQAPPIILRPLPAWVRFYVYGIQGLLDEIVFTALYDAILEPEGNIKLQGHSTIFTFFIYGSFSFTLERLYVFLYIQNGVKWYFRLPLNLALLYFWEFTFGLVLRHFGACSWDYSELPLNFMGLVTLMYAPAWIFALVLSDILSDYLLSLRVTMPGNQQVKHVKES